jgi:hypothetical protein
MATFNTIDEFLSHKSSDGGGGKYLRGWRKDKRVNVWLHTQQPITALWRHGGIPRVVTREKDGEQQVELWGGQWVCHENESVLRRQYRRNKEGQREIPPKACPLCKLIEVVHDQVGASTLDWTQPIFQFDADDESKSLTIHAGGLYNAYGAKLSDAQKAELKKAKISPFEAWKENACAKASYLFCVVDQEAPEDGVQIAIETGSLGDKVKSVISDAMESLGREEGNPIIHPYAIQWEYREEEPKFGDKYHARRMERFKLTPQVKDLIVGPAPDISRDVRPFNATQMRALLEQHALVSFPWDQIFDAPADDVEVEEVPQKRAVAKAPVKPKAPEPKASKPKIEEASDDMVACDECDAPMKETDPKCKKCGHVYIQEAPAPAPAKRKRSASAVPATPIPTPLPSTAFVDDEDDDGDVPF